MRVKLAARAPHCDPRTHWRWSRCCCHSSWSRRRRSRRPRGSVWRSPGRPRIRSRRRPGWARRRWTNLRNETGQFAQRERHARATPRGGRTVDGSHGVCGGGGRVSGVGGWNAEHAHPLNPNCHALELTSPSPARPHVTGWLSRNEHVDPSQLYAPQLYAPKPMSIPSVCDASTGMAAPLRNAPLPGLAPGVRV